MMLTVLGQVAFMPVLVLAAQLCPEVGRFVFAHVLSIPDRRCFSKLLVSDVKYYMMLPHSNTGETSYSLLSKI